MSGLFDIQGGSAVVAPEEKSAWVMLSVSLAGYLAYLVVVLGRARDTPLTDVAYAAPMLWTIGGAVVVAIVLSIPVALTSGRDAGKRDERDREISRFGDSVGQAFVVAGGVAALVLSMLEVNWFWIANAVYLAFALSAVVGSAARIITYRKGFQPW